MNATETQTNGRCFEDSKIPKNSISRTDLVPGVKHSQPASANSVAS